MRKDAPLHPRICKTAFDVEVPLTPEGEVAKSTDQIDENNRRPVLHFMWFELAVLTHTTVEGVIGWIEPEKVLKRLLEKRLVQRSKNPRAFELTKRGRVIVPLLVAQVQRIYGAAGIELNEVLWEARQDARSIVFDLDRTLQIIEVRDPKAKEGETVRVDWCKHCDEPIEFSESQCRWKHKRNAMRTIAVDHVAVPVGW